MAIQTFLLIVTLFSGSALAQEFNGECYVEGKPRRCEPVRMSFSLGQVASASSTCGALPTPFCVRSTILGRISSECSGGDICDANDPVNAHPPLYLTDFPLTGTYWQSENSLVPSTSVVVDIPLITLAEITVVTFDFHTIKPAGFYLERSTDYGQTYQPYHFFAVSCLSQYGINPDAEVTVSNETIPLCQTVSTPQESGVVSFFPAIDRPSANDSVPGYSENVYRFITATNIRVTLDQHLELGLAEDDPGYYYAIVDINVVGSCQCYGHASACVTDSAGVYECVCSHNTMGKYCDQCLDSYNDVPWQRADGSAFECKLCNCNNHSSECVFDPVVYEQTGQTSGGMCLNCNGNTAGQQCETCAEFYYPRPDREQSDVDICAECSCTMEGVTNNGDCAKDNDGVLQPGDCYCKANVIGRTCSVCAIGYYNFSAENPDGCQACNCSINGSSSQTCNVVTGECECKANVIGPRCDTCRQNYYQPDPSEGCLPCNCNLGGSFNIQCDSVNGQCPCQPGVTGHTCSEVIDGYFFPTIDNLRLEGESASSIPPMPLVVSNGEGNLFTGTGYYRVADKQSIANFGTIVMPESGSYEIFFRYNLEGALAWNTATLTIRAAEEEGRGSTQCRSGNELPVGDTSVQYTSWTVGMAMVISQNFCFRGGRSYTFILSDFESGQTSSPTLDIDSLVAIAIDISSLAVFSDTQLLADYTSCVNSWRRVPTISSAESFCEEVTFTFSTAIYHGTLVCDCDPDGTMAMTNCEPFGGQCMCLPGVRGRRCDECSPGTYNFSPVGCTSCACNPVGSSSDLCQPDVGTCDCLPNVAGPNCSSCNPNYYGLTSGVGCFECTCNEMGSQDLQCKQDSGECMCKNGVMGIQCDQCQPEHYGFSTNGCSSCSCDVAGSLGQDCEVVIGQCPCKDTTRTRDCSSCDPGTFNLQLNNPSGCQPCFCSGLYTTCISAPDYIAYLTETYFNSSSSDLEGWSVVSSDLEPHTGPDLVVSSMPFVNGVTILPNADAYLQAPISYLGNKLSSYSQFLTINIEALNSGVGVSTLTEYDVILSGNNIKLGVQFPFNFFSDATSIKIQLHESYGWVFTFNNQAATAEDLQSVLVSLDSIFITASFNSSIILDSVHLDTTKESTVLNDPSLVMWVEQCNCPANYTGLSCQYCAPGYTRTSTGSCGSCQCSGFSSSCGPENGACFNCTDSTSGASCEQCLPGTVGDPTQGIPCRPCPCPLTSVPGQFTQECMLAESGSIICLNCPIGHTGQQCEACSEGYFGDPTGMNGEPTGCSDCLCNGNIDSSLPGACNTTTGVCVLCLNNTTGNMCERCADGYYGDAIYAKNCSVCNCDPVGSQNSICDFNTGQCQCKLNIERTQCDSCRPDYFGLSSESGCIPCSCDALGSTDSQCDIETGQCTCKPGVTVPNCDQCMIGFFGLSEDGCKVCNCSSSNSILDTCDSNGVCQCEPGSTGTNCDVCLENYHQNNDGCTECPQCYQELLALVTETATLLDSTESILLDLFIETSPYEPRLNTYKRTVQALVDTTQELTQRHTLLLSQMEQLTLAINVTLKADAVSLRAALDRLKATSTPVFVLAHSAEELMNRTIQVYYLGNAILPNLTTIFIPGIQRSVSAITSYLSLSRNALQMLQDQLQQTSNETTNLSQTVETLISLASSVLSIATEIDYQHNDIETEIISLQLNLTLLEQVADFLSPVLDGQALKISEIGALIEQQKQNLPVVPSTSELDTLIGNLSRAHYSIAALQSNLSLKHDQIIMLQHTLSHSQGEVDSLVQEISDLTSDVIELVTRTEDAYTMVSTVSYAVQSTIEDAEQAVATLQNFSANSLEVRRAANAALKSALEITNTATYAIETAKSLQNNVSEIINTVEVAMDHTKEAENITLDSEMDVCIPDTESLVFDISTSLNAIRDSSDNVRRIEPQANGYRDELDELVLTINAFDQQVQEGSTLASESETIQNQISGAVNTLTAAVSSVQPTDYTSLSYIQAYLDSVEEDISTADIQGWYDHLNQSLYEQQQVRKQLEKQVTAIQTEVHYLRHLQSILPPNCYSDL